MTRTPDAHFYTEARYRGATVTAVAADYAVCVKFADTRLPAKAGTDAALAMAMTHVILEEFYIDRQIAYFTDYAKTYRDLPFAVVLESKGGTCIPGRFMRASDLGILPKEAPDTSVDYPQGYQDPKPYTPAWQEAITGVPQADVIRVAREFADNVAKTCGKSMIFLGAGTNHWYHSDMIYRTIIGLTTLFGYQGVNDGTISFGQSAQGVGWI